MEATLDSSDDNQSNFSIVKNVPQCKDLVSKEDLLKLWKSSDAGIRR